MPEAAAIVTNRRLISSQLPRRAGWSALLFLIALITSAPLIVALFSMLADTGDVWPHLARYILPEALLNTVALVVGVGIVAGSIGVSVAWLVAACEFPGRRFFAWALLLPMAMPGYVMGFAFAAIFDFTGPLQTMWRSLLGPDTPFPDIGGRGAAIAVLSLALYPYVYLIVREAFASQGVRSLEIAQSCGLRPLRGFFSVSLPMARPFIVGGVSLAVMECLADFGTVQLFNYTTFTTAIYRAWFGLFSLQSALQLSLVLVALVLIALLVERRLRRQSRYTAAGAPRNERRIRLSSMRAGFASTWCGLVFVLAFGLPASLIVSWSIRSFAIEFDERYWQFAGNSLMLSFSAAALITLIALLLCYSNRLAPGRINNGLARIATLGYAIPGTVLAVGFFVPVAALSQWFNRYIDGPTLALQSGLAVVFLAYSARYVAVAHNPVESALQRIKPSLEEASRGMGVTGLRMLRNVHVPILRPAIVIAALLVFVDIMKELPITLMTRPFGWDTLAVRVFQLTTEGEWERAALPALAIVLVGLIPVVLLSRRIRQ